MIEAMGGDPSYINIKTINELCRTKKVVTVCSRYSGYITGMNAENIGRSAQLLGAGRAVKTDTIDPAVGLVMKKRYGDHIRIGEPLCEMYINDDSRESEAAELFLNSIEIKNVKPDYSPIVYKLIQPE